MYIKIASITEILLGLAIGGFGGFALWVSSLTPGPAAITGFVLGAPMIFLGIFLIIFGINLWRFKKWAWIASTVILIIVIAFLLALIIGFKDNPQPVLIFSCAGAVVCLILLVLGKRKIFSVRKTIIPAKKAIKGLQKVQTEKRMSAPWKKILIIAISIPILILISVIEVPKEMVMPTAEEPIQPKIASDCEKETFIDRKDWCYKGVAQETKNSGLCGKIINEDTQNSCYAIVIKDVSFCEKLTNNFKKEMCYSSVAKETKDSALCEKIILSIHNRDNMDGCYADVAKETKDTGLCEKITRSFTKDGCYFGIAIETKDANVCEKIIATEGISSRDRCYDTIAREIKDANLCEKISYSLAKYVCYAFVTNDASICEKMAGEGKDRCYFGIATDTEDASLCEKIIDTARESGTQDQCYENIARHTKDSSLCKRIIGRPDSRWRDRCYFETPCRSIAACVKKLLLRLKKGIET